MKLTTENVEQWCNQVSDLGANWIYTEENCGNGTVTIDVGEWSVLYKIGDEIEPETELEKIRKAVALSAVTDFIKLTVSEAIDLDKVFAKADHAGQVMVNTTYGRVIVGRIDKCYMIEIERWCKKGKSVYPVLDCAVDKRTNKAYWAYSYKKDHYYNGQKAHKKFRKEIKKHRSEQEYTVPALLSHLGVLCPQELKSKK